MQNEQEPIEWSRAGSLRSVTVLHSVGVALWPYRITRDNIPVMDVTIVCDPSGVARAFKRLGVTVVVDHLDSDVLTLAKMLNLESIKYTYSSDGHRVRLSTEDPTEGRNDISTQTARRFLADVKTLQAAVESDG